MISESDPSSSPPHPYSERFNLTGVIVVSFSHFIHDVYSSFLAPLLPLLIAKLSMTLAQAGLLSTMMQLPAVLNPWIGTCADRISVRWFIILAPALTAVPMSLIGIAPTYATLLILMLFAGLSVSLFHVPAPVVVARMSGRHKGLGMSLFMVGGEAARAVGPVVAVGVVALLGLEGFYPVVVVSFLCSALLYAATRDLPVMHTAGKTIPLLQTWKHTRAVLLPITGILVARGFMHGSLAAFLPTYITMHTGNLWLAGAALTIFEAAGVAGVLVAGTVSDRLGRRQMLLISLLVAPVALLAFVWSTGWTAYIMLIFTGFTLLSTTPVLLALVQEHAGASPSAANGLFMMISFLARSAIVVVVGLVADAIGLKTAYLIFALAGFLALPFVFRLPQDDR